MSRRPLLDLPPLLTRRPLLSVVVVAYEMARELPRTLRSLSATYQQGLGRADYEILVVDNGSPEPVDATECARIDPRIRVHRIDDAPPSPAHAANVGVSMTRGRTVCLILDGARMVSPGVLGAGLRAMRTHPRPVVTPMAWHLGPAHQSVSVHNGYGPAVEDELLDSIAWPADGYRLFDVSVLAGANKAGFFGDINESCCLMVPRALWRDVDGLDERFGSPGGGFVSLDLFSRLVTRDDTELVVLLGEGSFHQVHGGASTGAAEQQRTQRAWRDEYRTIRDAAYRRPTIEPVYYGAMPGPARRFLLPPD